MVLGVDGTYHIRVLIKRSQMGSIGAAIGAAIPDEKLRHQRFNQTLPYMHNEMVTNINEVDRIRLLNEVSSNPLSKFLVGPVSRKAAKAAALAEWYQKVKSGADWDHKPKLEEMLEFNGEKPFFPIPGDDEYEYNYDIWSNIHYGYVGMAAGFSPLELHGGSIVADDFDVQPADELSIQIGIDLWKKYGPNLTPEQLHQAILDNKDVYLKVQTEENKVVIPIDDNRQA